MASKETKIIVYSLHLQFRLKFRDIPEALPKQIIKTAEERYFDSQTRKFVAVKRVNYKGKMREMAVTYEEINTRKTIITIHPLKLLQKSNRIKSGRWQKI